MSKDIIKKELKEISPKLASLKDQLSPVQLPQGFTDSIYAQFKSETPIAKSNTPKHVNIPVIIGIAASIILLAIYIGTTENEPEILPVELIEHYVVSNFDDYEEFINIENHNSDDWISQELEAIPENQLISYLENNLDQIDLENFIGNN